MSEDECYLVYPLLVIKPPKSCWWSEKRNSCLSWINLISDFSRRWAKGVSNINTAQTLRRAECVWFNMCFDKNQHFIINSGEENIYHFIVIAGIRLQTGKAIHWHAQCYNDFDLHRRISLNRSATATGPRNQLKFVRFWRFIM